MKRVLVIIFVAFNCGFGFSQSSTDQLKPSVGCLFNYSYGPEKSTSFSSAVRGILPVYKKLMLGAEVNYVQSFGKYLNSDALGGIAFARLMPYRGFLAEAGYGASMTISSARQSAPAVFAPFLSAGYRVKLNSLINVEAQYRVLPLKYSNDNFSSRIFLGVTLSL